MRKLITIFSLVSLLTIASSASVVVTTKSTAALNGVASGSTTSQTLTAGANLIIVAGQGSSSDPNLVPSDAQSDTFQACASNGTTDSTSGTRLWVWFANNIAGGSGAITVTTVSGTTHAGFSAYQVTGAGTLSCDQIAIGTGSTTAVSSGATPTLTGSDLVFASMSRTTGSTTTWTNGASFTAGQTANVAFELNSYAEYMTSTASTATCNATLAAAAAWNAYCVALAIPAAAVPTFSPVAGGYPVSQSVTISDATSGATMLYCQSTSTCTPATSYTTPVTVTINNYLCANASATGYATSATVCGLYFLTAPAPTFSPTPTSYSTPQNITLSDTLSGAVICYTTDGSTPTETGHLCSGGTTQTYSAPIPLNVTTTLNVIATKSGYSDSTPVSSGTYTFPPIAATPTFSPVAGLYSLPQTVSISDTTPSPVISYCLNVSTCTPSTTYVTSLLISSSEYLCSFVTASGYMQSATNCGIYTIGGSAAQGISLIVPF